MRGKLLTFLLLTAFNAVPNDFADILAGLESPGGGVAKISLSVSLPQSDDDIVYNLLLTQTPPSGNPEIFPVDYILEWSNPSKPDAPVAFASYFDGNHFRFRGAGTLREYHFDADSVPFLTPDPRHGVQYSPQFAMLIPAVMAENLITIASDSAWSFSIDRNVLTAVNRYDGENVGLLRILFDNLGRPLEYQTDSNIATISEQSLRAVYNWSDDAPERIDEQLLINRFPDVFQRFREENYGLHSLLNQPLPTVALPTLTGERYLHNRGDSFRSPTLVAVIDPATGFAAETIAQLRYAVENSLQSLDLVMIFTSVNIDEVESLTGPQRPGEHILINGRAFIPAIGTSSLPVILICDANSNVVETVQGFNPNLASFVIQRTAALTQTAH